MQVRLPFGSFFAVLQQLCDRPWRVNLSFTGGKYCSFYMPQRRRLLQSAQIRPNGVLSRMQCRVRPEAKLGPKQPGADTRHLGWYERLRSYPACLGISTSYTFNI